MVTMPVVRVGDAEDEEVKDDGDNDGQYEGDPDFHIWPDSVAPFLILGSVQCVY